MRKLRALLLRCVNLVRPTRTDAEMTEELQAHLDLLAHEYQRRGMSEEQSRQAAGARFGSVPSAVDAYRDRRSLPAIEHWMRDCRHAVRSLRHTGVLSASVILVLALGIGVTTAIATLFHAIVFRPLPLDEPDRIVKLTMSLAGDFDRRVEGHQSQFSFPELAVYQAATRTLAGVAGFRHENAIWRRGGERRPVTVALVTSNYFDVLHVRAAAGRVLTGVDATQPAAVISHRLWNEAFVSDTAALGQSILIDRTAYTVVGVADQSFAGTEVDAVDVWLPLEVAAPARGDARRLLDASLSWLQVIGRLAPDNTLTAARAEASVIATRYDAMHPGQRTSVLVTEAAALDAGLLQGTERTWVFGAGLGASLLAAVLLMICTSNAAALFLARGAARQRELALRMALGAGRWRILQQLVVESIIVALIAAAAGLILCTVVLRAAAHALPLSAYFVSFVPDATVLSFAVMSAFAAALLFGVAPAFQATRLDPLPILKQDATPLGRRLPAARLRHWLVASQVAVSLVLLVVSALLVRGIEHAHRSNLGFSPAGLYAVSFEVPASGSAPADRARLNQRLAAAFQSTPESARAGLAMVTPFLGQGSSSVRTGQTTAPVQVQFNIVDAGYFGALGVPAIAGRTFDARDDRATVIVNARLARALWGDERAALGQTLEFLDQQRASSAQVDDAVDNDLRPPSAAADLAFRSSTVVGVVPTLQSTTVGVPDAPAFYVPMNDEDMSGASFVVRARSRESLQRMLNQVIQQSDTTAAVAAIEERLVSQTGPARVAAAVAALIGLLALLVAGAGIYGIVAYSVVARTHEIGVHVALGAPRPRVLSLVLGSSVRAIAAGAAFGAAMVLIVAISAGHLLEPILLGVGPLDPLAFVAAIGFLATITASAAYIPARRALGVAPIEALRQI
jgi:predicted permease